MKKIMIILSVIASLSLVACGPSKDDPIKDYKHLKTVEGSSRYTGPTKEYVHVDREIPVEVEVPVPVEKKIIVRDEVKVEVPKYYREDVEQIFARDQIFQVSHEKNIKFVEGEKDSFEFTVKIIHGKVNFNVDVRLPKGAEKTIIEEKTNSVKFKVTWAPELGHIPTSQPELDGAFGITLKNLSFVSEKEKENKTMKRLFKAISNTKDVDYTVRRTKKNPKVKVVGLAGDQAEGNLKKFHVDVTAPGTYDGYLPTLNIFYDRNNLITSKGAEMNGALYVRIDKDKPDPIRNEDGSLRYHFVYDTVNFPMQAQFDKDMKVVDGADKFFVRVSFQAFTPFGTSSDKTMKQFSINFKSCFLFLKEAKWSFLTPLLNTMV